MVDVSFFPDHAATPEMTKRLKMTFMKISKFYCANVVAL